MIHTIPLVSLIAQISLDVLGAYMPLLVVHVATDL